MDRDAAPVTEFFAPFAHVPGQYEWCRIVSATHGDFDCFIVLDPAGTHRPATVYVHDETGQAFMRDRYPECHTVRVPGDALELSESPDRRTVLGRLEADDGPVRRAAMRFSADPEARPRGEPYGGDGAPVWGSRRFTCRGMDLVLDAEVEGFVEDEQGQREEFEGAEGVVTLGSYALIEALS